MKVTLCDPFLTHIGFGIHLLPCVRLDEHKIKFLNEFLLFQSHSGYVLVPRYIFNTDNTKKTKQLEFNNNIETCMYLNQKVNLHRLIKISPRCIHEQT